MLDLEAYGGADPLGMFPLFLKRTADVMAPSLSVLLFQWLVRLGSFTTCWRQAYVTPISKGPWPSSVGPPPWSSSVANYRRIP